LDAAYAAPQRGALCLLEITLKKVIGNLLGLLLLGLGLFFYVNWDGANREIDWFCQNVESYSTLEELESSISESEWTRAQKSIEGKEVKLFLSSTANYGRYTCTIEFNEGKYVKSEAVFLD